MSGNGNKVDERAPLLASQPSTVDAAEEARPDANAPEKGAQSISVPRGILCLIGLACLIFLQGMLDLLLADLPPSCFGPFQLLVSRHYGKIANSARPVEIEVSTCVRLTYCICSYQYLTSYYHSVHNRC